MMLLLANDLFFAMLRVGCDCWRCAVEVDSRTDTQDAGELVFLCKGAREIPPWQKYWQQLSPARRSFWRCGFAGCLYSFGGAHADWEVWRDAGFADRGGYGRDCGESCDGAGRGRACAGGRNRLRQCTAGRRRPE